jgi:hypothetical protein
MAVLKKIREFGKRNKIEFTHHARLRMYKRGISAEDIRECLLKGRIVESHPNDKPYPSYLLFLEDKYLYAVFVPWQRKRYIITAYYP